MAQDVIFVPVGAGRGEIQWTWIDKAGWPRGPWDAEPDKVVWRDPTTGYVCIARRAAWGGNWCGYVGVPDGHPDYGKGYDEVDAAGRRIEVHGGLTFAGAGITGPADDVAASGHGAIQGNLDPGYGDTGPLWFFGFDCAHAWDLAPGMVALTRTFARVQLGLLSLDRSLTYRTLDYVRGECGSLAAQLAAHAHDGGDPDGARPDPDRPDPPATGSPEPAGGDRL